jgi:hypothetical protein
MELLWVLECIVNLDSEVYVEHSVYVNNDFHGKELGKYYFKN